MEDALSDRAFVAESQVDRGDAALADAAKRDPHAFGELYERYHARVYRYVYHRVGSIPDAEDITAVVFMKALEGLSTYHSTRSSFAPWLFRITRNAVIDFYRRRKNQQPLDDLDQAAGDIEPLGQALQNERRDTLYTLVQDLSAEQREVVLMRYAADLSFREIASVMKKNEPAIRMLLHRGLRRLRTVVDNETI
ncbi:MAG: hypothetical protein NVS2B16_35360 [Chloroflexota bacterium]